MNWTPDLDARLRHLRGEKLSFTQIATRFGMAKGQVAGRCHRLGLCKPKPRPTPSEVALREAFDLAVTVHGEPRRRRA